MSSTLYVLGILCSWALAAYSNTPHDSSLLLQTDTHQSRPAKNPQADLANLRQQISEKSDALERSRKHQPLQLIGKIAKEVGDGVEIGEGETSPKTRSIIDELLGRKSVVSPPEPVSLLKEAKSLEVTEDEDEESAEDGGPEDDAAMAAAQAEIDDLKAKLAQKEEEMAQMEDQVTGMPTDFNEFASIDEGPANAEGVAAKKNPLDVAAKAQEAKEAAKAAEHQAEENVEVDWGPSQPGQLFKSDDDVDDAEKAPPAEEASPPVEVPTGAEVEEPEATLNVIRDAKEVGDSARSAIDALLGRGPSAAGAGNVAAEEALPVKPVAEPAGQQTIADQVTERVDRIEDKEAEQERRQAEKLAKAEERRQEKEAVSAEKMAKHEESRRSLHALQEMAAAEKKRKFRGEHPSYVPPAEREYVESLEAPERPKKQKKKKKKKDAATEKPQPTPKKEVKKKKDAARDGAPDFALEQDGGRDRE